MAVPADPPTLAAQPMPVTLMISRHEPAVVLLSGLVALLASYVALELARRVRTHRRRAARIWQAGGSLALGTGIWAMHFIGMLAYQLPVALGYEAWPVGMSWLAAVGVSALALQAARRPRLSARVLVVASAAMAAGICGMHYIGMAALVFAPGPRWDPAWVSASVLVALGASAVALWLFFRLDALAGAALRRWQLVAAAVMAAAITGMHYLGMAALQVPDGAVCLSSQALRGDSLAVLVGVASVLMLGLTLATALLDERMQAYNRLLAQSLQAANRNLDLAGRQDPLTGLFNRVQLEQALAAATVAPGSDGPSAALLYLDLDGLRSINEGWGHAVGDAVLREVADRLRQVSRDDDLVARLEGDHFGLMLRRPPDAAVALSVAERVLGVLRRPVDVDGRPMALGAWVGVALQPQDGQGAALVSAAQLACAAARNASGGQAQLYARRMESEARELLELQQDLRQALERPHDSGLSLHYQPKVRATDGCITGAEALLRWRHPRRGMVSPAHFVPLAERCGLIDALGAWVIEEACRQRADWASRGLRLQVAVNLSMHQMRNPHLVPAIHAALQQHGVPASALQFEITESVAMSDTDATLRAFDELTALGCQLAIDDFGTGYSSLAWLRKLPSRQLKIDRSFVMDLGQDADAGAIVRAVVQLAHALGLVVVAEGVETQAQRDALVAMGCDQLQGYLFARPVPGETLWRWALGIDRPTRLWFDTADVGLLQAPAVPA